MSLFRLGNKNALFGALFISLFTLFLANCDVPMGMGPQVDFEPPVLSLMSATVGEVTFEPPPNPLYVNATLILSGTVVDNNAVDKVVIFREMEMVRKWNWRQPKFQAQGVLSS